MSDAPYEFFHPAYNWQLAACCAAAVLQSGLRWWDPRVFGLIAIVWVFVTFCEEALDTVTEPRIPQRHDREHYGAMNSCLAIYACLLYLMARAQPRQRMPRLHIRS
jgi:hypothetical protein